MSCPTREEIDLARYLTDPGASEFETFKAHYPGCPECSEEVALWTAIEVGLSQPSSENGADDGPWHPDVEALARYAGSPDATGPEQLAMQRHLDACGSCRTEWQSLQSFDFTQVVGMPWQGATDAGRQAAPGTEQSLVERISGWLGLEAPPRLATVGAFAALLLVVGTWFALGPDVGLDTGGDATSTEFAQQTPAPSTSDAIPPAAQPRRATPDTPLAPAPSAMAQAELEPMPAPTHAGEVVPAVTADASTGSAVELADAGLAEPPGSGATAAVIEDREEDPAKRSAAPAGALATGDEVLLASLSAMAPPAYTAPAGASELAWMHQFGSVRGGTRGDFDPAGVKAHAPDHKGLTLSASPRLWWSVSDAAPQDIVITVVDDREIDPVLEIVRPGPQAAGLASIALLDYGIELEPGVEYRWFVTLVNDPDRPSRNAVSAGSIQRTPLDDAAKAELAEVPPAERGHELARRGYWYDSYDFFADLEARHPKVAALGDHRVQLLGAGKASD